MGHSECEDVVTFTSLNCQGKGVKISVDKPLIDRSELIAKLVSEFGLHGDCEEDVPVTLHQFRSWKAAVRASVADIQLFTTKEYLNALTVR